MSVTNRYFLAANGFSGFRCRFDSLLASNEIKRLYIIKGGSGVGKSTLMREVSAHFSDAGFEVEEILCSSDPSSLDGVVISSGTTLIVLIDGTAPHEYDMKYPAMRDSTIDLSKHIDEKAIEKKSESIVSLIKEKKKYYDFAYKYLHLAGKSYKILMDTTEPYIKIDEIKSLVKNLFGEERCKECTVHSRLYSAFSRNGLFYLDTGDSRFKKAYYFESGYRTQILFSYLVNEIKKYRSDITIFPSPFSDNIIDGFSVNDEAIFKMSDIAPTYKTDCYFEKISIKDDDLISTGERIFDMSISCATGALSSAFENHIALEEIYGSSMDFKKNRNVTKNLIEKISSEL